MMYSDKLVVALKVNGRVLRENGDTVTLPFGCEYSILLKNLNSVRAQINVSVDGQDAAGNLVIAPNSSLELERFIRNGNLQSGNRFKFIERTDSIEKHKGIGSDDGLIRVEGWRERVRQFVDVPVPRYYDDPIPVPRRYPVYPYPYPSPWYPQRRRSQISAKSASSSRRPGQPMMRGAPPRPNMTGNLGAACAVSDAGITVPGSASQQQFRMVSGFPLEPQSVVVVLRMRGEIRGEAAAAPITVDMKPTCSTCGKNNKANQQFCGDCGTALFVA